MNKQALRADILLLLTACIWGFAFTAQRSGMDYMGPFSYNGLRFLLGSLSLIPLTLLRLRGAAHSGTRPRRFFAFSALAGTCLFLAATLQQIGIMYTTAGNSGFITGLYVVLTPLFGIFLGRKTGVPTWVGAALTFTGLFFLGAASPAAEGLSFNRGDIITAVSAIFWTAHVLIIDALVKRIDPVLLSAGQFFCCGFFSLVIALFRESITLEACVAGIIPLLYGGLCSVGVAYTLQVVAQKYAPPAHATILLSLEGVFAALGGILLLSEPLGRWTLLGFGLMFSGMLATQWDVIRGGKKK
ncbi:MAG: DMT family transporter [Spirochaetaceae bacterium]|jgi:drug/metabolite transporter (DMT)-like permease|nr:DMT family transporter [Spirochaetaceae bacterium]